eukprot:960205-Ditylum_brightwellii.AAC.1
MNDAATAKPGTGYIITYATYSMLWASKIQTFVTLSTAGTEYVALSTAAREAIVVLNFLKEIKTKGEVKTTAISDIHCKMLG